jgi:hypothetical protein
VSGLCALLGLAGLSYRARMTIRGSYYIKQAFAPFSGVVERHGVLRCGKNFLTDWVPSCQLYYWSTNTTLLQRTQVLVVFP